MSYTSPSNAADVGKRIDAFKSAPSDTSGTLASSRVDGLTVWLQTHNVSLQDIEFKPSELCGNTMGAFATRSFAKGDLLFFVPKECIFGPTQYFQTELSQYLTSRASLLDSADQITVELLIWVHMLASKEGVSAGLGFTPYMRSLSDTSPSLLNYPEDLLSTLNHTNLGASITKLKHLIREKSALLFKIRADNPQCASMHGLSDFVCSEAGLTWACGHYLSRRYPVSFSPDHAIVSSSTGVIREAGGLGWGGVGALVPLLDILNH
eukprot:gene42924-52450_t